MVLPMLVLVLFAGVRPAGLTCCALQSRTVLRRTARAGRVWRSSWS